MKRLITIVLTLLLLVGCTGDFKVPFIQKEKKEENTNVVTKTKDYRTYSGKDFIDEIKNYHIKTKDGGKNVDNPEFDQYLEDIFVETMSEDYTTLHFNVINYRNYGITKPEVNFGSVDIDKSEAIEDCIKQLEGLQSFDYLSLSTRQQYDYEIMEYSLLESVASLFYSDYELLFNGSGDILSSIISILSDFTVYDQESLDDYTLLLKDVDRFLDDCLAYTKYQASKGVYMIDLSIDNVISFCNDFTSRIDNNALIISTQKMLEKIDFIDDAKKQEYQNEYTKIIKEEVIPEFNKVATELSSYYGMGSPETQNIHALCPEYAELLYMLKGSTNKSVNTIFSEIYNLYIISWSNSSNNYYEHEDEYLDAYENPTGPFTYDAYQTLNYLEESIKGTYPDLGDVKYEVQELDPEIVSETVGAYYWQAPIDDTNQNIIRVNPGKEKSDDPYEDFVMLAHEGIPGHLYQQVYFLKTKPANFRSVIGFIGYTEGWAVTAQTDALRFGLNDGVAQAIGFDNNYYFLAYSLIDIGINYYGWTLEETAENMEAFGFDGSQAESFYEFIVDNVGTYTSYGIGYTNFYNLKRKAQNILEDKFDIVAYNEVLLKNGPVPFNLLEAEVDNYIERNK